MSRTQMVRRFLTAAGYRVFDIKLSRPDRVPVPVLSREETERRYRLELCERARG